MGGQVEKTRGPARNLGMSKQARRNIQERREIGESGKDWKRKTGFQTSDMRHRADVVTKQ